jgi:hypothetical protein
MSKGFAVTRFPMQKKAADTPRDLRISRIASVFPGTGPSSNVSATAPEALLPSNFTGKKYCADSTALPYT